jgi:hypothetical protein
VRFHTKESVTDQHLVFIGSKGSFAMESDSCPAHQARIIYHCCVKRKKGTIAPREVPGNNRRQAE